MSCWIYPTVAMLPTTREMKQMSVLSASSQKPSEMPLSNTR